MDQGRITFNEMVIAIVFQAFIFGLAGAFISGQFLLFPISVVIGCGVSVGLLYNMLQSIDAALDLDSESAKRYGRKRALIRMIFMAVALFLAFYFDGYVNPWGIFLGILSLKFSAYLQPLIHKCVTTNIMKRRQKSK